MTTQADLARQLYEVVIRSTPEEIWAAIVTPEQTRQYFHGARIEVTPDRYFSMGPDGDTWGDGAVMDWDPPHRLVHEWRSLYDPELATEPPSRVTWEITPHGDATCRLTVTHDQLNRSPRTAESVSGPGWNGVLAGLAEFLEVD